MTRLITGYHGTKDLEGILKSGAILPRYYLQKGRLFWEEKKREYDAMAKKLADRFRKEIMDESFKASVRKELLYDGSCLLTDAFPNILENDYFLATSFLNRTPKTSGNPYGELEIGLTICLAYRLRYAKPYEGSLKKDSGAILKLIFPTEFLIPGNYSHMDFMGRLDLKYLEEVYAHKENLGRAINLLAESGLKSIPVKEIDVNSDPY